MIRSNSAALLKSKASGSAVIGVVIACSAVLIATASVAYMAYGGITPDDLYRAQQRNPALWLLDLMPFAFAIWGQHVSAIVAREADSMLIDRTHHLWKKTIELRNEMEQKQAHDELTGLPNRNQLYTKLTETIGAAQRQQSHFTLMMLDLEGLNEVNNTLGRQQGDRLLEQFAYRLRKSVPEGVTIARVSGDDFCLIIPAMSRSNKLVQLLRDIREDITTPFSLEGINLGLEANIGIAIYPKDADSADELLRCVEVATHICKKNRSKFLFYKSELDRYDLGNLKLQTEIHEALRNNEFSLYYQPKIDAKGRVREAEALVRWNHPSRGLILPSVFIPVIERKRLHKELLQRVLLLALMQAHDWQKKGIFIRIAVNLTAFDLGDSKLPELVRAGLHKYGLDPDVLKLELTETALIESGGKALETLGQLAEIGIHTSIDDFGTGYSSLAYLSRLPVNEVKIDASFVVDMQQSHHNHNIVQAIIALAHSLELEVVAEGVEDEATLRELISMDCDFMQGFHISQPVDAASFEAWLADWQEKGRQKKEEA